MHEFQVLTFAQASRDKADDELAEKMRDIFRVGVNEIIVDGAERRMVVEVRHICDGRQAGYLRVMPVNGKRTRRSMRTVHWTQIDRESSDASE